MMVIPINYSAMNRALCATNAVVRRTLETFRAPLKAADKSVADIRGAFGKSLAAMPRIHLPTLTLPKETPQ